MSPKTAPLQPLDERQRYSIEECIRYLRSSRKSVYKLIAAKQLRPIKQGRRTWIAGTDIARLSQAPAP